MDRYPFVRPPARPLDFCQRDFLLRRLKRHIKQLLDQPMNGGDQFVRPTAVRQQGFAQLLLAQFVRQAKLVLKETGHGLRDGLSGRFLGPFCALLVLARSNYLVEELAALLQQLIRVFLY